MSEWKRKGWWYEAVHEEPGESPVRTITVTRHLGFVTYHLIRLIHGEKELQRMAAALSNFKFAWKGTPGNE